MKVKLSRMYRNWDTTGNQMNDIPHGQEMGQAISSHMERKWDIETMETHVILYGQVMESTASSRMVRNWDRVANKA